MTAPSGCRATITRLRGMVRVMKSFGSGSSLAWATIDGTRPNTSSRSRCASPGSVYWPGPNGTSSSTVSVLCWRRCSRVRWMRSLRVAMTVGAIWAS